MFAQFKLYAQLLAISIILCIAVLVIMLPSMPPAAGVNRDSGVFLYIGQQILRGKMPYVDVWDHKGPLLFWINALGIWLGGRAGVWVLQNIFLAVSVSAAYWLNRRFSGVLASLWGVFSWLLLSVFAIGGNFTEEYSIAFSFLALCVFYRHFHDNHQQATFWLGVLLGLGFLLRPNNAGVQFMAFLVIFGYDIFQTKNLRILFSHGMTGLSGIFMVIVPVWAYFYYFGSWGEYWYASIGFNIAYAQTTLADRLDVISFFAVSMGWSLWFGLFGWAIILWIVLRRHETLPRPLSLLLAFGLPLELYLVTLSGRPYLHYLATLFPYLSLLNAFFISWFISFLKNQTIRWLKISAISLLLSMFIFSIWSLSILTRRIDEVYYLIKEDSPIVRFVAENTSHEDFVLVWGLEPAINFLSDRQSPSRYFYQSYFLIDWVVTYSIEQEFLADIKQNTPALIVIASLPFFDGDVGQFESQLAQSPPNSHHLFRAFSEYVQTHYRKAGEIDGFRVFIRERPVLDHP